MLAKDPSERYQSVHEVWVELRHIRDEMVARSSRAARAAGQAAPRWWPSAAVSRRAAGLRGGGSGLRAGPAPVAGFDGRRWVVGSCRRSAWWDSRLRFWYQGSQPALSFTARDWVLISDFENLTGDSILTSRWRRR